MTPIDLFRKDKQICQPKRSTINQIDHLPLTISKPIAVTVDICGEQSTSS